MSLLDSLFKKYECEMHHIQGQKVLSYTGGSVESKMSVELASLCPAKFWLTTLLEPKVTPHFFTEGSLAHGTVEAYHKASKNAAVAFDEAKVWLWSQNIENALKAKIWGYFKSYLEYPTKHPDKVKKIGLEQVRQCVIASEKEYLIDAVDYFSGKILCSETNFQGRVDMVENLSAYPVKKIDGRTMYVDHGEVKNTLGLIRSGDNYLANEGIDFFLKNLLFEKPVTKKDQKSISGEAARNRQVKNVLSVAKSLIRRRPVQLNGVTSDLKTSSGALDYERHIGQVSFYSYLRGVSEGKMPQISSIIGIEKKDKCKRTPPKRSRAIFSHKKSDFVEVVNKLERAISVVKTMNVTKNCNQCDVKYYEGGYGECTFFAICHAERLQREGADTRLLMDGIKRRSLKHGKEKR